MKIRKTNLSLRYYVTLLCLISLLTTLHPLPAYAQQPLVTDIAWSPNGSYIAIGYTSGLTQIINSTTGAVLFSLQGGTDPVTSVRWKPDGSRLATGSYASTVYIWDTNNGQSIATLAHPEGVFVSGWSPDGSRLFTYTSGNLARPITYEWNTTSWANPLQHNQFTGCMTWSPNGNWITVEGDVTVGVLSSLNLTRLFTISQTENTAEGYQIISLAWARNNSVIATGSINGSVRIWDANDGHLVTTLQAADTQMSAEPWPASAVVDISFNGDGQTLTSITSGGVVRTWDTTAYSVLNTSQVTGIIYNAKFSPDGSRIAFDTNNTSVQISQNPGYLPLPAYLPPQSQR